MLVKLQFDENSYDVIDVPKALMDWYAEHDYEFYKKLMAWLKNQGVKNYKNGRYSYGRDEVIEWLNTDLLQNFSKKIEAIALHKLDDPADIDLPVMDF